MCNRKVSERADSKRGSCESLSMLNAVDFFVLLSGMMYCCMRSRTSCFWSSGRQVRDATSQKVAGMAFVLNEHHWEGKEPVMRRLNPSCFSLCPPGCIQAQVQPTISLCPGVRNP
jgi:hypothetical protein